MTKTPLIKGKVEGTIKSYDKDGKPPFFFLLDIPLVTLYFSVFIELSFI